MGRIIDRLDLPNAELKTYIFNFHINTIKNMEIAKIHDSGATLLVYTFCDFFRGTKLFA